MTMAVHPAFDMRDEDVGYYEQGEGWRVYGPLDSLPWLRALPDRCVSLVFFSPPYEAQRTYRELGFRRRGQAWADWLRPYVVESARVSGGLVLVNAAGPVADRQYSPSMEWLVADLTREAGLVCGPAPYCWVKSEDFDDAPGNGTPGSGGDQYHRRDWEPVYSFCLPDRLPLAYAENRAYGRPPRYQPGGVMSNRSRDGTRANDGKPGHRVDLRWGGSTRRRDGGMEAGSKDDARAKRKNFGHASDGTVKGGHDREIVAGDEPVVNPGNVLADPVLACDVVRVPVGGGKLGHALAHEGDAPMPVKLAERFITWFVPPGGGVLDPFLGSGTTIHAALNCGRWGVGCDERQSEVDNSVRRLRGITPALFGE